MSGNTTVDSGDNEPIGAKPPPPFIPTIASPDLPGFFSSSVQSAQTDIAPSNIPEGDDPLVGAQLGNYRILSKLGKGGFGKVYKAQDMALGRIAAIKFLHNPDDPRLRNLFEREGKALAALSKHPHIVEIYEWGHHQGQAYFVLEFVDGSAQQLLDDCPDGLPVRDALRIIQECAEALNEAHRNGILHRDMKPANILIEPDTLMAKVTDFGLARFQNSSTDFTLAGSLSGSPPYMSPEQANSGELDARSDIFSLGVTLYQLLSGRCPFEGDSVSQILTRIRKDERTHLRLFRPDLPTALIRIVDKATAHNPEDRYQNAGEFARKLRLAREQMERTGQVAEEDPFAKPTLEEPRPGKMPVWAWGALGTIAAAVVVGVAIFNSGGNAPAPPIRPPDVAPTNAPSGANEAQALLQRGEFDKAAQAFDNVLKSSANDPAARLGLAMAKIKLGDVEGAERALEGCADPAPCGVARALVAYARDGAGAASLIDNIPQGANPGMVALLHAKVDALQDQQKKIIERLGTLGKDAFPYGWQFNEAQTLLGQAYFRSGDLVQAKAAFERARGDAGGNDPVIAAYLQSIADRANESRREELRETAKRIREQLDAGAAGAQPIDEWTSRPLTYFFAPTEAAKSRFAAETGLGDMADRMVGDALEKLGATLRPVDRALINEILREQELSAKLSTRGGQLSLGKVLGARFIMQCTFTKRLDKEGAAISASDVETTERQAVPAIEVAPGQSDPEKIATQLAQAIWDRVREKYPLQARLHVEKDTPTINIGGETGAASGMQFDILEDPGTPPIANAVAEIDSSVGAKNAHVKIMGIDAKTIPITPEKAWYVRQRVASVGKAQ